MKVSRHEPCPSGHIVSKRVAALDPKETQADGEAPEAGLSSGTLTLVLGTEQGTMRRQIPPAMPLRVASTRGKAAEDATHTAASMWGMPDFVLQPAVRQKGSGVRELGDGIIVLGELGLVLQVKSREATGDKESRECRWIKKQTRKALSQARGTIRKLDAEPTTLTNMRGREVELDGSDVRWLSVVIIDHDSPPRQLPTTAEELSDAVVLLRRDWEFLFDQLRSTHAVSRYLRRVAGDPLELGDEPLRYHHLAALDANARPRGLDPAIQELEAPEYFEPALPLAPAGADGDELGHRFFRSMLEDIASIELRSSTESQRIWALAELDSMPVRHRANVGIELHEKLELASASTESDPAFRLSRVFGGLDRTQLCFGACSRTADGEVEQVFSTWVQLRHHEFTERLDLPERNPITVGVLLTPRPSDGLWDTTMTAIFGPLQLSADRLKLFREAWGDEASAMSTG